MELISVIVPCYNEQESLPLFYDEIRRVSAEMQKEHDVEFEYIFINDGSRDDTLKILREMARGDKRVRYVSFSRNFGKEAAMYAGLEHSEGDYVVILDADLQHPPKYIPEMYGYVKSGEYDCAGTRRVSRKGEPKLLSFFARKFYKIINSISQTEIVDGAQDFRFMKRKMVDSILSMPEYNRFSKGIFSWVGFSTKYIEVENTERVAGTTTWNFWKLFKYSLEGIFAFSLAPLAVPAFLGILFMLIGFITALVMVIGAIAAGWNLASFAMLIAALFFVVGVQLFCMGIVAQYISKIYMDAKGRPIYIAAETEKDKK